ncbi:MAG: bifunctional UDP-3-O-[3-hydroxymyristoyl] N-acetylglucosamine deacetylase/3-hydroxyacyl-ACP dehydratase [Bacteroidota bacterium]
MSEKQKTIKSSVSISGTGLHTGNEVTLTFHPAPENHGYKFRRPDVNPDVRVPADADHVVDTSRGTSIEYEGVRIDTIEHVLAALAGLEIDNVLVEMTQSETPILDGSSGPFVEKLLEAGIVEQEAERVFFELKTNVAYTNAEKKIELLAIPSKEFRVSVMIDFDARILPPQSAILNRMSEFKDEIAPCRTFVFLHELEYLLKNNLIKGGDVNNAIIFVNRAVTQEELDHLTGLFKKPRIEVRNEGILNNLELKFSNEPARHKLLDVIGDLALIGMPIKAQIIASRPGHYSNVQFAKQIKKLIKQENSKEMIPVFDLNKPPLFDIMQIQKLLPHRPPFLLIDRILEMSEHHVVGLKNVTMNEAFFVGHFPNEPIMPGVLQIEAMAQTGGIFALSQVPDPQNYYTYFLKVENVRFRQKVVPGDTLIFVNELINPIRRGLCHMHGTVYVGQKIVMEGELLAQVIKK